MLADRVDRDDVRMPEPGGRVGLVQESVELIGRGRPELGDRLDRHDAIELQVASLVDDAHAAPADLAQDLVIRERWERFVGSGGLVRRHVREIQACIEPFLLPDQLAECADERRVRDTERLRSQVFSAAVLLFPALQEIEERVDLVVAIGRGVRA